MEIYNEKEQRENQEKRLHAYAEQIQKAVKASEKKEEKEDEV